MFKNTILALSFISSISFATPVHNAFDLSKAIKIGHGKKTMIEFADIQCPACRAGHKMINQNKVTQYVFLIPLPMHPNSPKIMEHIYCSANPAEEMHKAFTDTLNLKKMLSCPKGKAQLKYSVDSFMRAYGDREDLGVPFYLIDGKEISGFNKKELTAVGAL